MGWAVRVGYGEVGGMYAEYLVKGMLVTIPLCLSAK